MRDVAARPASATRGRVPSERSAAPGALAVRGERAASWFAEYVGGVVPDEGQEPE